jgi:hypothetical protein
MNTTNLEQKRKSIETAVKILALVVVGFIVAPVIFIAIKGLIGAIVAAVVGLVAINLAPSVAAMVANWRLKALKAVAAANPIETLENQYADRQNALMGIRDNIKESYAVLQDLYAQIQEHDEKYPGRPSQNLDKYNKLKALIELRGKKYKQAQKNLAAFGEVIEEKRSDWKIAQTMARASKLANVGEDFQAKLMQDTALITIQDGLNMAFSELETSLLDEQPIQPSGTQPPPAIAAGTTPSAARIPEKTGPPVLDLGFNEGDILEAEVVPPSRKKPV